MYVHNFWLSVKKQGWQLHVVVWAANKKIECTIILCYVFS